MKKTGLLILVLLICGCSWEAKNYDVFNERKIWLENLASYPITYYDNSPVLVRSEYINETSVKTNEVQTAFVGYTVVSDKTYQVDYYEDYMVKANMDGYLSSASVPDKVSTKKAMRVIGSAEVDGVVYRLLPSTLKTFVFLIKDDGSFDDRMGQIKNKRLVLLTSHFTPTPENLRMISIKNSKSQQTRPVKGFDLKYEGVELDHILFTYLDYSRSSNGKSGQFENLSFPLGQRNLNIKGVKIRVIHADDKKIDYVLFKD